MLLTSTLYSLLKSTETINILSRYKLSFLVFKQTKRVFEASIDVSSPVTPFKSAFVV